MSDMTFIKSLGLSNLLSFGSEPVEVELRPLNVLIGANASGKSNLLEAIGLLKSLPTSLADAIRAGGGIEQWLWKGDVAIGDSSNTGKRHPSVGHMPTAQIQAKVANPSGEMPLCYSICISETSQRPEVVDEILENVEPSQGETSPFFYYRFQRGNPFISEYEFTVDDDGNKQRGNRSLTRLDVDSSQSILAQRKDPDQFPEITYLGEQFKDIRIFSEWNLGRNTLPRQPQQTGLPEDFLDESANNLALVMNDLQSRPDVKIRLLEELRNFYEPVTDIITRIKGGTVQLYFHERGLHSPIPATRLSDGTLRYLCLLAVLLHPDPPPLVCIEEPELGMHPDILPEIARLLIEASERMQLIVTTHSDILVSEFSDSPESVVVCERQNGGTVLRRLDAQRLGAWLKDYSLGDLWRSGEIGANRW